MHLILGQAGTTFLQIFKDTSVSEDVLLDNFRSYTYSKKHSCNTSNLFISMLLKSSLSYAYLSNRMKKKLKEFNSKQ